MDQAQFETQLAVTQAMAGELYDYLTHHDLYRQMRVETPQGTQQPVMTLGALLENMEALRAAEGSPSNEQRDELSDIENQMASMRRQLAEPWRSALRRELKALLSSWNWALDDAERDSDGRAAVESEAPRRTRLDIIHRELANDKESGDDWQLLSSLQARQERLDRR